LFSVCLVETPAETEPGDGPESELVKKDAAIDVTWMLEHARQVYRLLPGGLTVLGVFIFHNEDVFAKQDGKLRKLLTGISNLSESVSKEQIVFVSNNVAKILDAKTNSFKNIDLKPQEKPLEFVRLDASMILDIPVARTVEEELAADLAPAVHKMEENLKHCIFVFGNKLLNDKETLGKPFELDKKKSKGKGKNESFDTSECDENAQTVINVDMLYTDSLCPELVECQDSVVRLKVAGKLCSRVYLAPGATVQFAKQEIVQDILRSLKTRFAMHCDTIQQDKEDGVEEEKRIVHEPPRRVFVTLDPFDLGVSVSDYLYPGEGSEDCINNIKELFGWQISEDNIEDDVEIVASPRDTRGPPPAQTDMKQGKKKRIPIAAIASLGIAAIAVGLSYFSLGSGVADETSEYAE